MKVFVVHAHPEPRSFAAVEELDRQGHEVQVSDLYAMHFDPVASPEDFGVRANPDYCTYALEQRHGMQTGTMSEYDERLHPRPSHQLPAKA